MTGFANIHHYDELKNLIADRPEFAFKFEPETNTYVIKYNLLFAHSFEHEDEMARKLLQEARGITFDANTGEVVSRKFHKFYNIGEKSCSSIENIDFSQDHWIMSKLDGSAIHNVKGRNTPVTKAGRSDVAKMVDVWFAKENYSKFNKFCEDNNWTASYEFCSPRQRIVVDYQEENLILTAIRDNVTGEYVFDPDNLKIIGKQFGIPVVDSYKMTPDKNIKDVMEEIRLAEGIEGIIIRFADGSMYKVKSEEYVRFHNAVSRVKQEKDVVKVILNDELDDILPILSEKDRNEVRSFADKLIKNIMLTSAKIVDFGLENYSDNQKEFALTCLDKNKTYAKFVLRNRELFDGKHTEEAKEVVYSKLVETILKESATGPRLEKVRDLFGGIKFTNIVVDEDNFNA